jgi:N-acetylmuramoyl-L-alanine amidase
MTVQIIQDFIPPGRRNRPGYKLEPRYITIHDTANTQTGADARAHANYLKSHPNLEASWHFTVDDKVIIQHLPLNENGWHAGDGASGTGNRQSIGIEICENRDGNRAKAEANAAWLVAKLLKDFSLGLDRVKQHYDWSGKNCPRVLRARVNGWAGFLTAVQEHLSPPVQTLIVGPPQATMRQAQAWARARGAHQRFIDIAPTYWAYAEAFGIRPEVLYAQSAKETAFGRYGGAVTPEMNNWAGIKIDKPTGDKTSDHQSFATPDDGVRGHFNHIAAYVGLEPIGTPHPRYYVVKGMPWAGTVRTVEELGAKWAPNAKYGESIVNDYLKDLLATPEPEEDELAELKKELEELRAKLKKSESDISALQTALAAERKKIEDAKQRLESAKRALD